MNIFKKSLTSLQMVAILEGLVVIALVAIIAVAIPGIYKHKSDRIATGSIVSTMSDGSTWVETQPEGDLSQNWYTGASSADGEKLIVSASWGNVYTSTDSGYTWLKVRPGGIETSNWDAIASSADGTKLITGIFGGRLYRSVDSGATWTELRPAGNTNQNWQAAFTSADGTKIVTGAFGGRLYRSSDSGETWTEMQPVGDVDNSWYTLSLSTDGTKIVAGVFGGRLYRSSDSGETWTEMQPAGNTNNNWYALSSSADGTKIFTGALGGRLYRSLDGGETWTESMPAGDIDRNWYSISLSADGTKMAAGVFGGRLYKSGDGGSTWTETNPAGNINHNWRLISLSADGNKIIAGATAGRLYVGTFLSTPTDTTPPTVGSQSPIPGTVSVPVSVYPTVTFSEAMDSTTVDGSTVSLHKYECSTGCDVSAIVYYNAGAHRAVIYPSSSLEYNTKYYIKVVGSTDVAGNRIVDYVDASAQSFTTAPYSSDSISPTVLSQTPALGTVSVPITVYPVVKFSEAMNSMTLNPNTVQIRKYSDDSAISIMATFYDNTNNTITLYPASPLESDTSYYIYVSGASDLAGNLIADYTDKNNQNFRTIKVLFTVISQDPAGGSVNVPVKTSPTIVFSKAVDLSTLNGKTIQLRKYRYAECENNNYKYDKCMEKYNNDDKCRHYKYGDKCIECKDDNYKYDKCMEKYNNDDKCAHYKDDNKCKDYKYKYDKPVKAVISYNPVNFTATITPIKSHKYNKMADLKRNTQYYIWISGVKSTDGESLVTDYSQATRSIHSFKTLKKEIPPPCYDHNYSHDKYGNLKLECKIQDDDDEDINGFDEEGNPDSED